jgi:hypothetical protein
VAKLDLNKELSLGSLGSLGSKGGKSRVKAPTKTSINLVIKRDSFFKSKKAIPVIIAIVILTCVLIGVLLVRPLIILNNAHTRVAELQTQLSDANKLIQEKGDVEEEYAHYTTEGMSAEELSRVDRVKVMKAVEDAVVKSGKVRNWSLTGNIATLQVRGSSLSELNQVAAAIEKDPTVDRCVINNANRGNQSKDGDKVAVTFSVYLNDANTAAEEAGNNIKAQKRRKDL